MKFTKYLEAITLAAVTLFFVTGFASAKQPQPVDGSTIVVNGVATHVVVVSAKRAS